MDRLNQTLRIICEHRTTQDCYTPTRAIKTQNSVFLFGASHTLCFTPLVFFSMFLCVFFLRGREYIQCTMKKNIKKTQLFILKPYSLMSNNFEKYPKCFTNAN